MVVNLRVPEDLEGRMNNVAQPSTGDGSSTSNATAAEVRGGRRRTSSLDVQSGFMPSVVPSSDMPRPADLLEYPGTKMSWLTGSHE